ncbi:MAG: hypothetical protein RMK02_09840 [Burkholderiales bacterium]|nr:hypothetical protein [Burkholderiales bacterium]
MTGCLLPHGLLIANSVIAQEILLQHASVQGVIYLRGSELRAGLNGDRMRCTGGLLLRDGFLSRGEVRFLGAKIGGELDCSGATFEVGKGAALSADGAEINGGVFLRDGFKARGEVRFVGARISGQLDCSRATFNAGGRVALNLVEALVRNAWVLRDLKASAVVDASFAEVKTLADCVDSWAEGSALDGFRYRAFGGEAETDAQARIKWLRKQPKAHLGEASEKNSFRPQPWRQLQRVLREMGHEAEARAVGIAFEEQRRRAGLIGRTPQGTPRWIAAPTRFVARSLHAAFGLLAGYGYRPLRLLAIAVCTWLICALVYWSAALPPWHAIGPSDPLVFQNPRYAECVPGSAAAAEAQQRGVAHAGNWFLCKALPGEYPTFSPLADSLDVFLPLVELGQERAWGPLVPTPQADPVREFFAVSVGHAVRLLVWLETLFGWVVSLLFVAIVTGLARRSDSDPEPR